MIKTADEAIGHHRPRAAAEQSAQLDEKPKFITWELDLATWRFTRVGPRAADVLGYPLDTWYEPGFWQDHIHPDDRDEVTEICASVTRTGEDQEVEYRMINADGRAVWLRNLVSPVADDTGQPIGLRGVMLSVDVEKRALQAARESEQRFRDFADATSDWFWETDETHVYTWVSDSTKAKLGVPPEWFLGRRRMDIADTTIDPRGWEEHERRLAAHEPYRGFVIRVNWPEGARWIRSSGVPVFDESGRFRGYRGTGSDVTAQVEAEEQTRRALELFENGIESIPVGFTLYDADDRFVTCNNETLRMMGETAAFAKPGTPFETIVRSAVDAGFIPAAIKDPEGYVQRRMEKHRNPEGPIEVEDKDRWLRIHESRMPDGGTVTIHTDITARVRAERETERTLALFRSAIDCIPDGFALFDAEDRFVTCNEPYCRPQGEPAITIAPGTTFESLIRGAVDHGLILDALEDPEGWIQRRMEMHRNPQGPFEVARKNRWLRIQESRMPDGGTVIVLTDITREKQREEQLRQTQKMDALGKLTGGLAHDFNNLLAVIAGNVELIFEELTARPDLQSMAQATIRASERGATLTRSLLAFARQQPLTPVDVDLNRLVAEMSELIRRTIPENIAIRVSAGEDLWHCTVDAGQLQNALLNLVVNARDAMPEGGTLTIETAAIGIDEDAAATHGDIVPGDYVMLAVSDTGTGMPPEVIERAFDPFFTMKPVGKGTGLGLSMVYGLAKQSGGHAVISSDVGVGTTIRLYLPRQLDGAAPAERSPGPVQRASGDDTILVVEDDPDLLTLVVNQVRSLGYRVEQASDGISGLEVIARHPDVALLLTDVVLAGDMTGPELARQALAARPDLQVLLMSGYAESTALGNSPLEAGVRMLYKPFSRGQLSVAIGAVLQRG